jgi:hypothetical protein
MVTTDPAVVQDTASVVPASVSFMVTVAVPTGRAPGSFSAGGGDEHAVIPPATNTIVSTAIAGAVRMV